MKVNVAVSFSQVKAGFAVTVAVGNGKTSIVTVDVKGWQFGEEETVYEKIYGLPAVVNEETFNCS